jgi:tRNA pseudouridine38-40 synthase
MNAVICRDTVMERNILLTIEYDGGAYSGWQIQPNVPTVQGEVEKALRRTTGRDIGIHGTSRTDAGVHAYGQRASFKTDCAIPTEKIAFAVNNALPKDIRIREAREVGPEFHARFSCTGKQYIYKMKEHVSAFESRYYYEIGEGLDIQKMQLAATYIKGTHDFKCFQAAGSDIRDSTVRTIFDISVNEINYLSAMSAGTENGAHVTGHRPEKESGEKGFALVVSGDGFLYNMVRIITGTLVDAGRGKIVPEELEKIIAGRDRTKAGHTAPPQGLYLAEVFYPETTGRWEK